MSLSGLQHHWQLITRTRALATQMYKHLKLNINYVHELITFERSVYFDNISVVQQLMEKPDFSLGKEAFVLVPVNSRSLKRAGGRKKVKPEGSAARSGRRPKLIKNLTFKKTQNFRPLETNAHAFLTRS